MASTSKEREARLADLTEQLEAVQGRVSPPTMISQETDAGTLAIARAIEEASLQTAIALARIEDQIASLVLATR